MYSTTANTVLIDLHYLPCIAYFSRILQADQIMVEVHEHYPKQTYRNRCYLQIANKVHTLTVPVSRGTGKIKTKDVRVSYSQQWQDNHWRTITSAYGKAPFFEFFADELYNILHKKHQFLVDLNLELLTKCLKLIGADHKSVILTETFQEEPEQVLDCRDMIKPKIPYIAYSFFDPLPYNQVFGKDFVPNLSVIDLLFCEGPRANHVISQSLSCAH